MRDVCLVQCSSKCYDAAECVLYTAQRLGALQELVTHMVYTAAGNKLIGFYVRHRAVEEAELRLRMEELEALEAAFDGLDGPPGPPLPPPSADFNWRSSAADMDLPRPR